MDIQRHLNIKSLRSLRVYFGNSLLRVCQEKPEMAGASGTPRILGNSFLREKRHKVLHSWTMQVRDTLFLARGSRYNLLAAIATPPPVPKLNHISSLIIPSELSKGLKL